MALSQQCVWSWFRFSVALPLGINGADGHAEIAASTPFAHRRHAARRAARAGATPGVGLQLRGARFRPRWLRPAPASPYSQPKTLPNLRPTTPPHSACRPSPRAAKPLDDEAGDLKVARATLHSLPPVRQVRRTAEAKPIHRSHSAKFVFDRSQRRTNIRLRWPVKDAVRPLRIRRLRADR